MRVGRMPGVVNGPVVVPTGVVTIMDVMIVEVVIV
jgi:hypothetical protein